MTSSTICAVWFHFFKCRNLQNINDVFNSIEQKLTNVILSYLPCWVLLRINKDNVYITYYNNIRDISFQD